MSRIRLPAPLRFALAAGVVALGLAVLPASAQTDAAPQAEAAPQPGDVIVTIGDQTVTEADISFAAEDLGQELQSIPPQRRRPFLVAVVIDMKLMANAARAADLDETEIFKRRLAYLEEQALRRAYFSDTVNRVVTDEAIKAAYDAAMADFQPVEEVRARHIIVSSKEDAEAVKKEIDAGKPFEMAALEYSQDGTAQNGGDLGYFNRESALVQSFKDAAFALAVGTLSDPVETQFGWHLIRVDDKRMSEKPGLDVLRPQLQQQVVLDTFASEMEKLKQDVTLEFTDPTLEAAVRAEDETLGQE
ncbi:MAG: peptidylprolyl isomerase [Alphaproteobacteria bacterium]|nr:peptidylprolyl isomerase [Alphaproteobacteria bacterium]